MAKTNDESSLQLIKYTFTESANTNVNEYNN